MTQISFENASVEHLELLTKLAMSSNAVYGYRTVPDEEATRVFHIKEDHLKKGILRLMKERDTIIGFYGLIREEKEGKEINLLSHLFLKPEYIGKGYGKKLFREAMRAAQEELRWESLLWESDPHSAWFYQKMGAKRIGENLCPLNPSYKSPVFVFTF